MSTINIFEEPEKLESQDDNSVNFVFPNGQEARYVDRGEYVIVYLSSHGGCNRACRMCHLTQTGQTEMEYATVEEMCRQAEVVLRHYSELQLGRQRPMCYTIHFNWMARGEPLDNPDLIKHWQEIADYLRRRADARGFQRIRFNISTIMPAQETLSATMTRTLSMIRELYKGPAWSKPTIFYSAYSASEAFRKRWLPKAMQTVKALRVLAYAQKAFNAKVVMHHALISTQNDSVLDAATLGGMVKASGLKARFNLVRYNPFSPAQGREPDEGTINRYFQEFSKYMQVPGSRIVPRVGFDVKASCGCFVNIDH